MPTTFVKLPTFPVKHEPLVAAPRDILCPGSDNDESREEHRKKRRRIERQAHQYLQGQPLFILSASLRGPLDDEWFNPWARKRPEKVLKRLDRGDGGFSPILKPKKEPEKLPYRPNDFRDGNERDLIRDTKHTHQPPTDWLKSDSSFFHKRNNSRARSPTPTPTTKPRDRELAVLITPDEPLLKKEPPSHVARTKSNGFSSNHVHGYLFTPINKHTTPRLVEAPEQNHQPTETPRPKDDLKAAPGVQQDQVNPLAQETDVKNHSNNKQLIVSRPSLHTDAGVTGISLKANEIHTTPLSSEVIRGDTKVERAPFTKRTAALEGSFQELPPSTNLPEFEYRYAARKPLSLYHDRPSFAETLEIEKEKAKAAAQEHLIRTISFTESGNVKKSKSQRRRQRDGSGSPSHRPKPLSLKSVKSNENSIPSAKDRSDTVSASSSVVISGGPSHDVNNQPEAQFVPPDPIISGLMPSGPSTDLLETDKQTKFPGMDEGDSYAHLSTQAAVLKAQTSFQNSVVSPLNHSPPHRRRPATSELGPAAPKRTKLTSSPIPTFQDPPSTNPHALTPEDEDNDEPMSTQAMVDAMSPFVITTVKKRKRTSFAISPASPTLAPFAPRNHSMSTTPVHTPPPSPPRSKPVPLPLSRTRSKPSSSGLNSFSLAPNGSSTDMYQHDGQQQPPTNYLNTSSWDLDAAIEEAGQFLGHWNVEHEARKEGKLGSSDVTNGTRGSQRERGLRSSLVPGVGGSG